MINKFENSSIDFKNIDNIKKDKFFKNKIHDYIKYPEKDYFEIPENKWSSNEKNINNFRGYSNINEINNEESKYKTIDTEMLDIDIGITPKNKDNELNNTINNTNIIEDKIINKNKIEMGSFIDKTIIENNDDDIDIFSEDENGNLMNNTENNNNNLEKEKIKYVYNINQNKEVKIRITSKQLDGLLKNHKEEKGILRSIKRMRNMKKLIERNEAPPLPIKKEYEKYEPKNIKNNSQDFPIERIMKHSLPLSSEFIIHASEYEIPFKQICVNILIDCSYFICDENKIYNMYLVCAITFALNVLEIPYSIALVSDEKFKIILKKFDEPYSKESLQKVLDCLLIRRYRTKIASSFKFAEKLMEYPNKDERPYRAIFIFTDGLDETLVQKELWTYNIFNNEKLSFGLFFVKSIYLKEQNLEFVEEIWKDFENDNKKSLSPNKIAATTSDLNPKNVKILKETFIYTLIRPNFELKNKNHEPYLPLFEFKSEIKLNSLDLFKVSLNSDFSNCKGIYFRKSEKSSNSNLKISQINYQYYKNKLNKIITCDINSYIQNDFTQFIGNKFIENRRKINFSYLETIFKPNKASQKILSTTGTEFDITALILNLINPVPEPMIYLEEKGGFIRNYSVTVIIDPSKSCFNKLSTNHSLETIRILLSSLAAIDLPSFDLIIAGENNPYILCSDIGTSRALNKKSELWKSLFTFIQYPLDHVDLASAIYSAFDLRRLKNYERTSILFVLTDGLFEKEDQEKIIEYCNYCSNSGINIFGIGLGIYPIGIEKLFSQIIYSNNPKNLFKGIASFFGDHTTDVSEKLNPISLEFDYDLTNLVKDIAESSQNPTYKDLKEELSLITPELDAFDGYYNMEQEFKEGKHEFENPVGLNKELYTEECLKGQKILIVMLWTCDLSENESEFIRPEYILIPNKEEEKETNKNSKNIEDEQIMCIKSAADHYGIELKIVLNYEDAINEITKQSTPGLCDYYAVWVICGPPYEILPIQENENKNNPHLINQFINVLIEYWKKQGSIFFLGEGNGLHYQLDLFLERAEFPKVGKVKFKIDDEHKGEGYLFGDMGDEKGNIHKNGTFNKNLQKFKDLKRSSIGHELLKIFEGISISYVKNEPEKIKPFIPFSIDNEGGINSLFYCADEEGHGDIVIDCGYTKFFTQMRKEGTFRYIQNIIGWMGRPEVHDHIDKIDPTEWRPSAVIIDKINKNEKWTKFKKIDIPKKICKRLNPKEMKTLFAIDCSRSIRRKKSFYHQELNQIINEYYKEGDIFYLWSDSLKEKKISREKMKEFTNKMEGYGNTNSSLIAEIALDAGNTYREHLLIVTDGEVPNSCIDKSTKLINDNNIKFKYVTTFIIGEGSNLSVGAPYCRDCPNITFAIREINKRENMASLLPEDIQSLSEIHKINNYEQFIIKYPYLDRAIQSKMLGAIADKDLITILNDLKQKVEKNIKDDELDDFKKKWNSLNNMANGKIYNTFTIDEIAAAKKK